MSQLLPYRWLYRITKIVGKMIPRIFRYQAVTHHGSSLSGIYVLNGLYDRYNHMK